MRIALLAERFAPHLGGADRRVADWATWLAGRGHDVRLLVFDVCGDAPPGITVRRIDASGPPRARAERLEAAGRAAGADLLHDLGAGLGGDMFQPLQADRVGRAPLEAERLRRCRLAVAGSARIAAAFEQAGAAGKIRILRPGVDTRRFRPASPAERSAMRARFGWAEGSFVVLMVAADAGIGRIAAAAWAAANARRRDIDVRLVIAVRESLSPARRTMLACLARVRAVSLIGDSAGFDRVVAAADAFLQPGRGDADDSGLAAMAAGLPIIVHRGNSAAALITEGVQGWELGDRAGPGEIARRIRGLHPAELRQAMGVQARVLAQHHDIDAGFRRLESICLELARSAPGAAG